ncbi:MAG: ankyrin repeat domain-containing protein, partial [Planctomycetes bacterium]|nr:ankyrin repeat domain-containing protein [Planctomycetota bacterium]
MERQTQNQRYSSQSVTFLCLVISTLLATADLQSQEVTPLHIAASGNDLQKVVLLLEKGAEVNARDTDGWTPLMVAAGYSSTPEIVALLIK